MSLLTAKFGFDGRKDTLYNVVLTKEKIIIIHSDPRTHCKQEIALSDVIGARAIGDDRSVGAFLHVYSYPKRKPRWGSQNRRREEYRFFVHSEETQEGNIATGDKWKHAILSLVRGRHIDTTTMPEHQKYLVLINPASGSGKAKAVYYDHVHPMLQEAEAEAIVIVTERAAHAQELIKNMDIEQLKMFTAIVIVSGDGLIHEVFNGIMERRDWKVAIQTPVAAIPGGSGNALVTSLLHAAGEPVTPTCAVVALLHGQATPIDLATVQTRDKTYYSFLSLTWGLAADIDINSEKFRFLGNSRFAVSFLSKMVMYPKYRGRLHYLPVDSLSNESDMVASDDHRDKPLAHLLPPLTDSISEDQGWKFVTGEFVTVIGTMLSHLSEDLCIVPDAASNGGVIYLLVTGGDVSRMKVFKAFTGNLEVIKLLPVRAIRLEPEIGERARRSYMVLDGERIDYGAVQMQIHKGLGRVVALDHGKALSL